MRSSEPGQTVPAATTGRWWTGTGLAAALVAFASITCIAIVALPLTGTSDSLYHLDYVYQLHNGHIPAPYGLEFTFSGQPSAGSRQYASAHPPLFYAVAGLVAGTDLNPDGWGSAVLRIRLLNLAFGCLTVIACAWVAALSTKEGRRTFVIGTAAMAPLATSFVLFSADVYNDVLLTLLATASLALALKCMRFGTTWARVTALSVVMAAGMLTKATFVIVLIVCAGAVVVSVVTDHQRDQGAWARSWRALVHTAPTILVPLIASGRFYLHNYALSGSWMRSTPKVPVANRSRRGLQQVLHDPDFYTVFPGRFLGNTAVHVGPLTNQTIALSVFACCVLVLLIWTGRNARRWAAATDTRWVFIRLAPGGVLAGLTLAQLSHAVGYGALNFRYFLPSLVLIGLVLAGAATLAGPLSGLTVSLMMMVMGFVGVSYMGWLVTGRQDRVGLHARLSALQEQALSIGCPPGLLVALGLAFVTSCVVVGVAVTAHAVRPRTAESAHSTH